ncbi:MAG: hypothetical protein Q4B19_08590 [Clostridia bacterium]|nr:hypothetical protein [Clostridia bacterium]
MTRPVLGLPLEDALAALAADPRQITITEISAPRGEAPRGTLRVVAVRDDGSTLVAARFPDHIAEETIEEN